MPVTPTTRPEQIALVDLFSNREFTYAELNERVGRVGGYLRDVLGVERGDRIGVLSANSTDIMEIQFACFRIGAIFIPLNWRLAPPELEFIVGDASPKVLICDEENFEVGAGLQLSGGITHLIDLKADGGPSSYESGIAAANPVGVMIRQTHDDACTLLYTSGTTERSRCAGPLRGQAREIQTAKIGTFHRCTATKRDR